MASDFYWKRTIDGRKPDTTEEPTMEDTLSLRPPYIKDNH